MTEHFNPGGSAFPSKVTISDGSFDPFAGKTAQGNQVSVHMGMSLRDYFAAKAMQGVSANEGANGWGCSKVAEWAFRQADAMLRARDGVK